MTVLPEASTMESRCSRLLREQPPNPYMHPDPYNLRCVFGKGTATQEERLPLPHRSRLASWLPAHCVCKSATQFAWLERWRRGGMRE